MPIDFGDPANARAYSGRDADESWYDAVLAVVDPAGARVVDVGCGGGTYTRAFAGLGAATVTGVDASGPILASAREAHGALPGVSFVQGDATATALGDGVADVVFARALVHHLPDLAAFAAEVRRLLAPGGTALVQDRTVEDALAADPPRGWLFEVFPRLREVETARRPDDRLVSLLAAEGLAVTTRGLVETRRRYADREDYLGEVAGRTGRSVLHELDDAELVHLVEVLRSRLPAGPVVERDRWTLWVARA